MFDLTLRAFNLAEEYRTPVVLLADEIVAHMRERMLMPRSEDVEIRNRQKPESNHTAFFGGEEVPPMPAVGTGFNVSVTGSTHDEFGMRFTADAETHRRLVTRLVRKVRSNAESLADFEASNLKSCDVGFVSYGCTSRAVYEVAETAATKGVTVGHVRLRTIWPFPDKVVRKLAQGTDTIIVPEMNLQQLFFEVKRSVGGLAEVMPLNKVGGGEMLSPEELLACVARKGSVS
jgi:2-oxoglutarate ferredoxin oxidoreductase subunit alpha